MNSVSKGRTTEKERNPVDGSYTMTALKAHEAEWRDQMPILTRCAVLGCGWTHEGSAVDGREAAAAHRVANHPELPVRSATSAERKRRAQAEVEKKVRAARQAKQAADAKAARKAGRASTPAPTAPTPKKERQWARRRRTPEEIVAAFKKWAEEHGGVAPSQSDWRGQGGKWPSERAVQNAFGTWGEAIEAAGLEARKPGGRPVQWTVERVKAEIQAVHEATGRAPHRNEMPAVGSAASRLGLKWPEALALAGIQPGPEPEPEPAAPERVASARAARVAFVQVGAALAVAFEAYTRLGQLLNELEEAEGQE